MEILAGIYAMRVGREGLRRAGRPGMGIINPMSSCAAGVSTIAASHPEFGARPSDAWLVVVKFYGEVVKELAGFGAKLK
jgi:hypothetical protein